MLKEYVPDPLSNHPLSALSSDIQGRLLPHLELVDLPLYAVLYNANRSISHVLFPVDSIISLQYLIDDGESTVLYIVGNEGLLGGNLNVGSESTSRRSLVQIVGHTYRLLKHRVEEEFERHAKMIKLTICDIQCFLIQVAQTAVCNRHHPIYKQLCLWLLISLDRLVRNDLKMTQEFKR